jgi:hypothetical protein
MLDQEALRFIRDHYGDFIVKAAGLWRVRASVVAGIMMRETQGGLSPLLSIPGPGGKGDKDKNGIYHGHGLMQIDNRSFPAFCQGFSWSSPEANINFGTEVFYRKTRFFARRLDHLQLLPNWNAERLGIASYNAGEGNILRAVNKGVDPDLFTARHNYSAKVLEYASLYEGLANNAPKAV